MKIFSARETELLRELDGMELAGFWQRAGAFLIDFILMSILFSALATLGLQAWKEIRHLQGKQPPEELHLSGVESQELTVPAAGGGFKVQLLRLYGRDAEGNEVVHVVASVIVPVLYFGILLWAGNGRTPGKRMLKIRVVSLAHRHMTFWHSVERALGYGAATLELGFGFVQFFIHPYRRCAQDRLAETIVVTERSYQALQEKLLQPPSAVASLESPQQVA